MKKNDLMNIPRTERKLFFDWQLLKRFFKYFRPKWSIVAFCAILVIIISLLQVPGPFLTQFLIDSVLPKKEKSLVFLISLAILVLLVLKSLITILNRYLLSRFRENLLIEIKGALFQHILSQPISFFKNHDVGYTITRIMSDTQETQGVFADNLLTILSNLLTFIVGISALFYIHWKLALISLLVLPVYILGGKKSGNKIRDYSPVIQENAAKVGNFLGETFMGAFVIKIFSSESKMSFRFRNILEKIKRDKIKMSVLTSLNSSFASFIGGLGTTLVIWYGILEIINGRLTIGEIIAFNQFLGYLYNPLSSFIGINAQMQRSYSAISRIFQIMDLPGEYDKHDGLPKHELKAGNVGASIRFEEVSFSYDAKDDALKNISFHATDGELVAVVGKSGAGKSTMVNLIPRFYDYSKGKIFIDDFEIKHISKKQIREIVGYVPQDTFLFNGTILDNIKFANMDATEDEIFKAVASSGFDKIIRNLELGYDTDVGVVGSKISGGQKQLISIARVLLRNPRILIFDEATAHLDYETEKLLKQSIELLVKGRTTFIIAHRLTTILGADKIIVLEKGEMVGIGTHDELYKANSFYKKLFDEQFPDSFTRKVEAIKD